MPTKRPQRPSDIQRKSSRHSSEFHRSTSQISHDQQTSKKNQVSADSSAAMVPANKTSEEFKTMTENNMKMTSGSGAPLGANLSGIDSSDYENDEEG